MNHLSKGHSKSVIHSINVLLLASAVKMSRQICAVQEIEMNDFLRFQKIAGLSAIFLTVATLFNVIALFASVNYDSAALFSNPATLLLIGSRGANLFHWSMVFDLFAYLPFAPIALLCLNWFAAKGPNLVVLYTICGVAYSLINHVFCKQKVVTINPWFSV